MPDSYVKQNCCPIKMLGDKSDIYLEIHSMTNVSSVRIYIGTIMGYPTQFSMSGKLLKVIWNTILPFFMMKLLLIGLK